MELTFNKALGIFRSELSIEPGVRSLAPGCLLYAILRRQDPAGAERFKEYLNTWRKDFDQAHMDNARLSAHRFQNPYNDRRRLSAFCSVWGSTVYEVGVHSVDVFGPYGGDPNKKRLAKGVKDQVITVRVEFEGPLIGYHSRGWVSDAGYDNSVGKDKFVYRVRYGNDDSFIKDGPWQEVGFLARYPELLDEEFWIGDLALGTYPPRCLEEVVSG